jgi:hypothetical protein
MPSEKEFKMSKELQALAAVLDIDFETQNADTSKLPRLNAVFESSSYDLLSELVNVFNVAKNIELGNFDAGKKDNTHLVFVKKTTKLAQRALASVNGKPFTPDEVEKITNSFEKEFHVNKKLRIAGAVLLGVLVAAAIAAIAFATFGLATTIPLAGLGGIAAFKAFMIAASAKIAATAAGLTGSTLGIVTIAGAGATVGFTATMAGLGAKIAGTNKQARLDALRNESTTPNGTVINSGAFGKSIHALFRDQAKRVAMQVPAPQQNQQKPLLERKASVGSMRVSG